MSSESVSEIADVIESSKERKALDNELRDNRPDGPGG